MPAFTLTGLALTLAWAVLRNGAVLAEDLNACLLAIALLSALYWAAVRRQDAAPPPPRAMRWLVLGLPVVLAIQILPLPLGAVRVLSPMRAELAAAAAGVVGPRAVTLSAAPAATITSLCALAGCVLVFLLIRELAWRFDARPWLPAAPLLLFGALEALAAIAGPGTFINRNHVAGFLAMLLPFPVACGLAAVERNSGRAGLISSAWLALAALLWVAVAGTLSRMGFLAALAGLFAIGFIRCRKPLALAVALAAIFLLVPSAALIERFGELGSSGRDDQSRTRIWRDTVPLIRDYPLFGCGLGAYEPVLLRYKTAAPLNTVDFAHNDYLQLLAEGGIVGFTAAFVAAVCIAAAAVNAVRTGRSWVAAACLGSFSAIAVHSAFDFNLHIPANAFTLAWIAGLAVRER